MKKALDDNRGLTLLELLISILILAMLASPLLHSFITAASSARKTRALDFATNAASNFIENVKAENDLAAVLNRFSVTPTTTLYGATAVLNSASNIATGTYVIDLSGLSYGNRTYSGRLTLDASPYLSDVTVSDGNGGVTTIPGINNTDVVKYSFSGMRCGTEMSNVDVSAAITLTNLANFTASAMYAEALAALSADAAQSDIDAVPVPASLSVRDILNNMSRRLTLTVKDLTPTESDEEKKQIVITAAGEYSYTLTYDGQTVAITPPAPFVQEFFGAYDRAIYFFYYPLYTEAGGTGTDNIIIYNNPGGANLDFMFFLVKQRPLEVAKVMASSAAEVNNWMITQDISYINKIKTKSFPITVYQDIAAPHAKLSSNIGVSLGTAPDVIGLEYRQVLGGTLWATYQPFGSALVELMRPNRLYLLSIELTGDDPQDSSAIKIETTTLDFPDE